MQTKDSKQTHSTPIANTNPHPCESEPLEPKPTDRGRLHQDGSPDGDWVWNAYAEAWELAVASGFRVTNRLRAALHEAEADLDDAEETNAEKPRVLEDIAKTVGYERGSCEGLPDAVKARIAELEGGGWRPASEPPEAIGLYLGYEEGFATPSVYCWNGVNWTWGDPDRAVSPVTHWHPLPAPPKSGSIRDALDAAYKSGGKASDKIADPEAASEYLKHMEANDE